MISPLTLRAAPGSTRGGRQRRERSSRSILERRSSPLLARAVSFRRQGGGDASIAAPKEVFLNDAEFLLNAHEKVTET
jgi:hypothetical protein